WRSHGAIAVDYGGGRTWLAPFLFAHSQVKILMDPFQRTIPIPQHQVPMRGALGRKVLRQSLPLATRPQHVEYRVEDFSDVHRALATATLGRRNQRRNQRPFLVRQIAVVAQSDPACSQSMLRFPHWRPSSRESLCQIRESQPTLQTQQLLGSALSEL